MNTATDNEFAWLEADSVEQKITGLDNRAQIMRRGAQEGKDRIWWTDGDYIWFRRSKSNPATLERHNRFMSLGDYEYVETQGDVEIYAVRQQSQFAIKEGARQVDIGAMDNYNVRRQAVLAACKRDWKAFRDITMYLRERINKANESPHHPGMATPLAENIYAEQYMAIMASIEQRNGPSPGEINQELLRLLGNTAQARQRIITFGQ